jgi:hypothetical protein
VNTSQRLTTVNYAPATGSREFWQSLSIAAGFVDTLCVDDLSLLGKSVADEIEKAWKCPIGNSESELLPKIAALDEAAKTDLRRRASRRSCGRAYPGPHT